MGWLHGGGEAFKLGLRDQIGFCSQQLWSGERKHTGNRGAETGSGIKAQACVDDENPSGSQEEWVYAGRSGRRG